MEDLTVGGYIYFKNFVNPPEMIAKARSYEWKEMNQVPTQSVNGNAINMIPSTNAHALFTTRREIPLELFNAKFVYDFHGQCLQQAVE